MTTVNNQLQQYLNMFAQSASTFGTGSGASQYKNAGLSGCNCLWELIEGVEGNNADQISSGVDGFINTILSLINGCVQKASDDVQKTDQKTKDGTEEIAEIKKASNEKIQAVIDGIKGEANKVELSIKELQKIVGDDGTLIKAQKELEQKKKEIEEQKSILNNPDATIEERKAALVQLTSISSTIKGLAGQIAALEMIVQGETTKVEAATAKMEEFSAQGEQIVAESLEKAGATVTKTSGGVITNVSRQTAEGTTEEAIGSSMVASGAAAEATIVGAAAGAQMQQEGLELIEAGTTHLTGSAGNMADLGAAIGKWGGDFTSIGYDMQLLGLENSKALVLVGTYDTLAASTITSIGSWSSVADITEELDQAVETYAQAIDADVAPGDENSEDATNGGNNSNSILAAKPSEQASNKQQTPLYKTVKGKFSKFTGTEYKEISTKSQEEVKNVKFDFETSKFKVTPFSLKKQK